MAMFRQCSFPPRKPHVNIALNGRMPKDPIFEAAELKIKPNPWLKFGK